MIVLNVTYVAKPGLREDFYDKVKAEKIPEKSRAEEGNIKYEYFMSADDENEILLIEHWKDADAFDFHTRQAHFKRLQEIKADYLESADVERYEG